MTITTSLAARSQLPDAKRELTPGVADGIRRMGNSRVVICGLARDVGDVITETSHAIENLGAAFSDYQVVLFENDSTDNTKTMLAGWSEQNSRITVISETLGDPVNQSIRCLQRATRMAYYRNQYLKHITEHYADYDYAIVVDTDLGGNWSQEGIASTFGYDDWDFVGSYGIIQRHNGSRYVPLHYDAWAFRVLGDDSPMQTKVVNHLKLDSDNRLMPVNSCFGGLGVYRMSALLSAWYSGEDCEQVTLNRRMREAGYDRLFLNSQQTTHYGWHKATSWRMLRQMWERLYGVRENRTKQVA